MLKYFATSINGPYLQNDPLNIEFASRVEASGLRLQMTHDSSVDGQSSTYLVRVSFYLKGQETEIAAQGTLSDPDMRDVKDSPPTLTRLANISTTQSPYIIEAVCLQSKCRKIAVRLLEPFDPNAPIAGVIAGVSAQPDTNTPSAAATETKADVSTLDGAKPATAAQIKLAGADNVVSFSDKQATDAPKAATATIKQVVAIFRDPQAFLNAEAAKLQAQQALIAKNAVAMKNSRGPLNQRLQSSGALPAGNNSQDQQATSSENDPSNGPNTLPAKRGPKDVVDYLLRWISSPQGTTDAGFSIAPNVTAEESRRMQLAGTLQLGVPQATAPASGPVPGQGLAPAPAHGSAQNNAQLNGQANAQVGNQNQAAPATVPAGAPMIAPVGGAAPQPGVNTPGADDVGVVDASGQPITNQAQPNGSAPIPQAPAQISPNTVGGAGQG